MDLRNGKAPKTQQEMKPEDYILEANQRAGHRTTFVSQVGFLLFQDQWKVLVNTPDLKDEEIDETMAACLDIAERWRQQVNSYHEGQAKAIHDERVHQAAKSKLILPTWGEVRDHYPNGMFGGPNLG